MAINRLSPFNTSVPGILIDKGVEYLSDLDPATGLASIPSGAVFALIQAHTEDVRWMCNETTSNISTQGMVLKSGDTLSYSGQLAKIKLYSATGGVSVQYYGYS